MNLPAPITRFVSTSLLKINKNSPTILAGVAVAGVVTTAVLAVRGSKKIDPIVLEHRNKINEIREGEEQEKSEVNREVAKTYFLTSLKIANAYLPAALSGAATIACIVGGTHISNKRYLAMSAAYKGIESSFAEYRKRIEENFEKEAIEKALNDQKYEVEMVDEESGHRRTVRTNNFGFGSPYARVFDHYNFNWSSSMDQNDLWLKSIQSYMNDTLKIQGHVVLNDVYKALGFSPTPEGYVVGWVWQGNGDNFIDFGLDRYLDTATVETGVPLDFNVDGFINDLI